MSGKFEYAPGLPGYGVKGSDGSMGLNGVAMYFTDYDGITDKSSIKNRISNNQSLISTSADDLPDYPTRKYQSGDLIIDKNGKVYEIDLSSVDLYSYTNASLALNTLFVDSGITTNHSYERYANDYLTNKFIVDSVYASAGTGDYTLIPNSMYNVSTKNFAQINYNNLLGDNGDYYPFKIFTVGTDNDSAVGLLREKNDNVWHFGNTDGTDVRDVEMHLDFATVRAKESLRVDSSAYFFDNIYAFGSYLYAN